MLLDELLLMLLEAVLEVAHNYRVVDGAVCRLLMIWRLDRRGGQIVEERRLGRQFAVAAVVVVVVVVV